MESTMIKRKIVAPAASLVIAGLLCSVLAPFAAAQRSPRANAAPPPSGRPKLVVILMVDQFRYDYLERFADLFGNDGFKRLMNGGAFFTQANYDYVPTVTAAGHAAVHTGSVPAMNGINGNIVVDAETGKTAAIVADSTTHVVTSDGVNEKSTSASPRSLSGTTIGDQIRLSNNFQSKVIALSQKDRAAVLPGGHKPNGAFWYSAAAGSFISSDYYYKELPAWVKKFNTGVRPDKYFNAKWDRALPAEAYRRAMPSHIPEQQRPAGDDFPYTINGGLDKPGAKFYSQFEYTPFVSEYLENFAEAAIDGEALGADEYPDLLAVSFSAPDLIGHAYGPDSQEIVDVYARLDRTVAALLKFIDRRVGMANTLIAVTGDHGVAPIPKLMEMRGYEGDVIPSKSIEQAVNAALKARFGGDNWLVTFANDQLFLNHKLMAERKADPAEAERIAGEAALTVKGMANYFTRTQILEGRMPAGDLSRRVMNGYYRQRAGDVWLIARPYYFFYEGFQLATTHGSPYHYDTHVPVIFYGAGVRPGRYNRECTPSDIAPTIAALLGVEAPSNNVGRVLVEAIAADGLHQLSGQR
jgi:predicted AlkP superfamily pyrophosphatase or phosphodiesterase